MSMNPENAYKEFDGNLLELEIFQNHFPILGKYASNIPNQFFFLVKKMPKTASWKPIAN